MLGPRLRRRAPAGLALVLLVACWGLVACGGSEPGAGAPGSGAGAAEAGAFPARVPGRLGTAEIPREPRRVVALDTPSADAALAVGVVPVAIAEAPNTPDGLQPWTADALRRLGVREKPQILSSGETLSVEEIAGQRTDLVLAAQTFTLEDLYPRLRGLAPVVGYAGEQPLDDTWEDTTVRVGRALGREGRAREQVTAVRRAVSDRARTAGLQGRSIALFNYATNPFLVKEPDDASVRFFAAFGMRPPAAARDLPQAEGGRTEISEERIDVLDADVVAGVSQSFPALRRFVASAPFQNLDAARERRYVELTNAQAISVAFPSVLSVPWSLDRVVPRLRAAAAGRGQAPAG